MIPFEPQQERGLMVILPHPDDETFSSGGTLARCADAGTPTLVVCGTYGDMGRRMGSPPRAHRESLRDIRLAEMREAAELLGSELIMLGLRDKCIEFEDPDLVAAEVRALIEAHHPSSVIGFYPGFGVHSDHDALGLIVQLAVRMIPPEQRPRLLAVAVGDREANEQLLGEPHIHSDISGTVERKIAALRVHRSQTEAMFAAWESGEMDDQQRAFEERMRGGERYYLLDPDAVTDYERGIR